MICMEQTSKLQLLLESISMDAIYLLLLRIYLSLGREGPKNISYLYVATADALLWVLSEIHQTEAHFNLS